MLWVYLTIEDVIDLHAEAMRQSGDQIQGINPENLAILEASLHHLQNDEYYETFDAKLTHLLFSTCKAHAFVEGNKRASLAVGGAFLEHNGLQRRYTQFMSFMENVIVCVADNKISKEFLREIVVAFLREEEDDEELSLRILEALEAVLRDQALRDAENQPPEV
ncbi:Fic family protein [Hyphomicrobium sp.]|uniref:Fic family protein n=1 Tax=Hyphomicrobium sp. TaxID=82 RepID=UPI001E109018|nr:Fic family protein [Hyphomicrobium sp.]MBY0559669.1 Fic family protein [Hyphomicrobium sp.]